jgi:DNA-binding NarL/FixJ family response regulator
MQEVSISGSIIGREPELALLDEVLEPGAPGRALVISGQPGIGKTTLWRAAKETARARGMRVLSSRPSGAEARLLFAALTDLLDEIDFRELPGIPAPQLRALEVALLRAEPAGRLSDPAGPSEQRAISAGFLSVLRALGRAGPVLVAIDDVQWLDPCSNDALTFAGRRIHGHPVSFLLSRRSGNVSELERALEPAGPRRLKVNALSLGATQLLLSERLGLSLSRRLLRALFEKAEGNPLFALELGRMLAEREEVDDLSEIQVPDVIDDLFGPRVVGLSAEVGRSLLAVALGPGIPLAQLGQAADPLGVQELVTSGLLRVNGERVRLSHPLLGAAAVRHSSARERRGTHLALARSVTDDVLRARHLALASARPDADVAAVVAAGAASAFSRGARHDAVELSERALRLTPTGAPERSERLLALASHLNSVGALQRLSDLLAPNIDSLDPGNARARAWLLLAEGGDVLTTHDYLHRLDLALAECPTDPGVRACVLAKKAHVETIGRVQHIAEAEEWAEEALRDAPDAGPQTEMVALGALAWARVLRGRPVADLTERFDGLPIAASFAADWYSPGPPAAERLVWRGEVAQARATLASLVSLADAQGDAASYTVLRFVLCDLELRIGEFASAAGLLDEFGGSDRDVVMSPNYEFCRALLAAGRGEPGEAERWAAEALEKARAAGIRFDAFEASRAIGMAALLAGEPERAAQTLLAVWEQTLGEGVEDPGAFPVAPDLVEALVETGDVEAARAVAGRLCELAETQQHPWGLASAKRCGAVVQLSLSFDEQAAADLAEAAADFGRMGLAFDRARCLLLLGRAARRYRKRGHARRSLELAVSAFERAGAAGWAGLARSELSRIGARKPTPEGRLTSAETSAVELAAAGLSNKQIAHRLFISVHTVERHLSHAYAKLGVRSRSQLAAQMSPGIDSAPPDREPGRKD